MLLLKANGDWSVLSLYYLDIYFVFKYKLSECNLVFHCGGITSASDGKELNLDMALQELPGKTLGEKHRCYNELVKKTLDGEHKIQTQDFNKADNDVINLVKIDVAAKNKNVEYILKILQCDNMLYVSRAIKQSKWLTESQYSHLINPQYLHTYIFPNMMPKAISKFLLHIRLHLKDVERVDEFYNYVKEKDIHAALAWLPYCSLPLAEKEVAKHSNSNIERKLRNRLYEKSHTLVEIIIKNTVNTFFRDIRFRETMYLLEKYSDKEINSKPYLDFIFDTCEGLPSYYKNFFGPKSTSILMKKCRQRILDNIETYCEWIDMNTFVKHLTSEEINNYISKVRGDDELKYLIRYDNYSHLVRHLPEKGRFEFIRNHLLESSRTTQEDLEAIYEQMSASPVKQIFQWYGFAPFNVSFPCLTEQINTMSEDFHQFYLCPDVYDILLRSANRNQEHIQTVLKHFNDKFHDATFEFKIRFVNKLITRTDILRYNETNWNALNDLFISMKVYDETEESEKDEREQICIGVIVLYKLLHNENIPDIIEQKFNYLIMGSCKKSLTNEERDKVFEHLYKKLEIKIQNKSIESETDLSEIVPMLQNIEAFLKDWNKNIVDYSWIATKVKEIVNLKKTNSWKVKLAKLYFKNVSWRRIVFEESLLLSPSEETCYNALKHDPELMSRHQSAIDDLRCDDKVSLRRVLRALRLYWPQTLAAEWMAWYLARLEQPGVNKSIIRGLCTLATPQQLIDITKKYSPAESNEGANVEENNIRNYLAGNMHLSRPLPSPDIVLLYVKHGNVHAALPSLNAVFDNMSSEQTREHVSKLFDAPVSLQKLGFRIAFTKLDSEVLYDTWTTSEYVSVRWVLFKQTYDLLCKQTQPKMIQETWDLLGVFMDDLSIDENDKIYERLKKDIEALPELARLEFFTKRLLFFKSLPTSKLQEYAIDIDSDMTRMIDLIEQQRLDPGFVTDLLIESGKEIFRHSELMATYMLCVEDEESQSERYRKVLLPLINRPIDDHVISWLKDLLQLFSLYFQKYAFGKNMAFPTKLFSDIQQVLNKLPFEKYYELQTTWKLYSAYVGFVGKHKEILAAIQKDHIELSEEEKKKKDRFYSLDPRKETKWNEVYKKALPEFSKACLAYLREDINKYAPYEEFECNVSFIESDVVALKSVIEDLSNMRDKIASLEWDLLRRVTTLTWNDISQLISMSSPSSIFSKN
ncbi:hypothetical protein NE865_13209 [Phthorimaea operculella]|nr:hypothetical protein NE865_13209 [Phthorimaea operculella]